MKMLWLLVKRNKETCQALLWKLRKWY